MTTQGALYLAAVLAMFLGFAGVLAWTDYSTNKPG